jgi:hypothetical protein
MEMLDDKNHLVDVYIETYKEGFRPDYGLRNENQEKIIYEEKDIFNLFNGFNVIKISIENQNLNFSADDGQRHKIIKAYETFSKCQENREPYDLIVKSRMDLYFDEKINYENILAECKGKSKLILGSNVTNHINDTFAIGTPEDMKKYFNRFSITNDNAIYNSINSLASKEKITIEQKIVHHIVRLSFNRDKNKFVKCSFCGELPIN